MLFVCLSFMLTGGSWTHDPAPPVETRPAKVRNYIKKYRYLAVQLKQASGIPMSIIFGLAGLESNWGTSELAVNANNHFGIKDNKYWNGPVDCRPTQEFMEGIGYLSMNQCFRKYTYIADSYRDFGQHLSQDRYKGLYNYSPEEYQYWARTLQQSGYATDPAYAEKLIGVIERYQLYEWDK